MTHRFKIMKIGPVIKKYRQKVGFTQIELARRVAVQSTYLSAVENDKKEPSIGLLKKLSKALCLTPEIFFWEAIDTSGLKGQDKKIVEMAQVILQHYQKSL